MNLEVQVSANQVTGPIIPVSVRQTEDLKATAYVAAALIFTHAAWAVKPEGWGHHWRGWIDLYMNGQHRMIEPVPATVDELAAILRQQRQFTELDMATQAHIGPEAYEVE